MQTDKLFIRHCIRYEFHQGKSVRKACESICSVLGDNIVSKSTCEYGYKRFKEGDFEISKVIPFSGKGKRSVKLLHDNARPHVGKPVKDTLLALGWEAVPHPAYSPDLAPSDYHLFWKIILALIGSSGTYSKRAVRTFPEGFQFGASTAAYQIEGGWNEDGKGLSIWDVATHMEPSPVRDGSSGDIAADSYHLYKRDVEMMKEIGLDYYRFSVSWARILPSGFSNEINQAGINYYNNLIDEMLANGISPFVTLYHSDLPHNLQKLGGWVNPIIVDYFANYAQVVFDNFGDRVKFWITINEPKPVCYGGYGSADAAPQHNMSGVGEYLCSKNLLLAHAKAYRLYDEYYRSKQNGFIGISIHGMWHEPATDSIDDQQAVIDAMQFDWGQYAHPIFSKEGDFPYELKRNVDTKSAEQGFSQSRLPKLSESEIEYIKGTADFFGLNTYTSKLAYRNASLLEMYPVPSYYDDMGAVIVRDDLWPESVSSWLQEVPWGLTKLLLEISKRYDNPPIYITENGWSTFGGLVDDDRIRYLRNHLDAVLDAIEAGSNVKSYTYWSLMDNFEWLRGYREKFGLYEVDFTSLNRTRTPRKSAFIYREIVRTKTLDFDYEPEKFTGG
ncbi:myrosinase 1-like [Melitaea cinxia]|uniref:myrosinase 1-like n=1 Tax=Melitaea cinxia TaxID=113334 RepID=UPI001E274D8E|nr:myrosinase 1-like [Melitaea cinxia]